MNPIFHEDSYGYRPGRSALDAVARCRERCWKTDWVVDIDIKAFFDTIPHDLIEKAVAHHTRLKWLLLYVRRWLEAPLQREDGTLVARGQGSPQGSAISPTADQPHLPDLPPARHYPRWFRPPRPSVLRLPSLSSRLHPRFQQRLLRLPLAAGGHRHRDPLVSELPALRAAGHRAPW